MSPLRKTALAWGLAVTALAGSVIGGTFLYLQGGSYTDPMYVEANIQRIATERNFKLEEARAAGYSETEIAAFMAGADRMSFERTWARVATTTGLIYAVVLLGVAAATLAREGRRAEKNE